MVIVLWMGPALILQNQDNLLYLWNQEIYALSENPKEDYLAISLCPEAQPHLGYAAGQWPKNTNTHHIFECRGHLEMLKMNLL